MNGIMNLGVPKLFELLEKHSEWESYYFNMENSFPQLSASIGKKSQNMPDNRYCNVWPWNHSRVVLGKSPDYINGSHIKSPIVHHQYIATQEPLHGKHDSTKDEFWRMVWEQNSSVVIMLNDPSENNSYKDVKYYPYYPTGLCNYTVYTGKEGIKVTLLSREDKHCYFYSKLELKFGDHPPREIHHLQFRGWGDYEVPDSAAAEFFEFLKKARGLFERCPGPPVVHCSAGVGRTGTFILADVILEIAKEKKSLNIDVKKVLECLREQRMWLVQTPDQLRFCFMTIVEGATRLDLTGFTDDRISV